MLIPAHIGLSWLAANLVKGNRRLRAAVFLTGILPDIDGFGMFVSQDMYCKYHHVLSHGLPFSVAATIVSVIICKGYRLKALLLTQLAFYLHYFGDYFFTKWRLYYLAPFSMTSYGSRHSVWLYHPINVVFMFIAMAIVIVIAVKSKRTPLEIISRPLDDRLVSIFFRRRTHRCSICSLPGNEHCSSCGTKLCIWHSYLTRHLSISCKKCFHAAHKKLNSAQD